MKKPWFKRIGWFYLPVSLPGAVIAVVAVVFCIQVFLTVDHKSHSISDTLYGVFPYFACSFLLYDGIAGRAGVPVRKEKP